MSDDTPRLRFRVDERELAIVKLDSEAPIPRWVSGSLVTSITRTSRELSIVCDAAVVPSEVRHERGWATLELEGPFPFALTGILASFITPLAEAQIGIFALSTFDTDLVLVKLERLEAALDALASAGHQRVE